MRIDRQTLNLIAPAVSTIGGVLAVVGALRNRKGLIGATLGAIGSVVWLMAALQEAEEARATVEV